MSHSPAAIKSICQRALLLDQGSIVMDGEPEQVLDYYNAIIARSHADYEIKSLTSEDGARGLRSGTGEATIERVELIVDGASVHALYSGQAAQLKVYARSRDALEQLTVGILIRDRFGNDVFGTNTMLLGETLPRRAGEAFCAEFCFASLPLGKGSYSITVALHSQEHHIADNYDWWDRALVFEVVADFGEVFCCCYECFYLVIWNTRQTRRHTRVLPTGKVGMKAHAKLKQCSEATVDLDHTFRWRRCSGDEFEQGALACSIDTNERYGIATRDFKADVLEYPTLLMVLPEA